MKLKHDLISVDGKTFGGNQLVSRNKVTSKCGCGRVSALEVMFYLNLHKDDCSARIFGGKTAAMAREEYDTVLKRIRRYVPLMYPTGTNGLFLAIGINLFFLFHRIPMIARWCIGGRKLFDRIDEMLENDIPVIISAGPSFIGRKQTLALRDTENGRRVCGVKAHYMTVFGADESSLYVSSWSGRYRISKNDFTEYAKHRSGFFVSNIVYIHGKKGGSSRRNS